MDERNILLHHCAVKQVQHEGYGIPLVKLQPVHAIESHIWNVLCVFFPVQ